MLLSELAQQKQFYVTFFQTLAGHKPRLIGQVGVFADIKSAEQACRQYFIQNVVSGMMNSAKQALDQGKIDQDEYQEMVEMIDMDMDEIEEWEFGEYENDHGQTLWDMGGGEYAFSGKYGSYPTENDVTNPNS